MGTLPWIPFDVNFPTGEHAISLKVALQKPLAWAHVVQLWAWVARFRPDGKIEGPAAVAIIEEAAGWDGPAGAFVEALTLKHIGLLDVTERGFYIHNWHLHCGAHIKKRERDRVRHRKPEGISTEEMKSSAEVPRSLRGEKTEGRGNSTHEKEKEKEITTTGADAPALSLDSPPAPKPRRIPDAALEALEADLSAAYREVKGEELDWPKSAHGELVAIRKAIANDAEVLRRWRQFLADAYWPIKNVHKFREAFQHAKFQRAAVTAAEPKKLYPSIPVFS